MLKGGISMNKLIALFVILTLLSGTLSGCANIQNDRTRTQTEGLVLGAGVGGVTGAGIGAAVGGGRGAVIGAIMGSIFGGAVGLAAGTHVADQKAKYASEEAWLDACLQQAEQTNNRLKAYNQELTDQIAVLDQETKQLQSAYAARTANQSRLLAEQKKIEGTMKESTQVITGIDQEIAGQQKVLANAQASKKSDECALLEAEIASLKRQKAKLEETNRQLAAMSARISV
jgi:hypothetical protein